VTVWRRNLFAVTTASFIGFTGFTLVMPFLPLYFRQLGVDDVGEIALWSGLGGAIAALGPLLSGAMLEHFWWGSIFIVNVPIVIAGLVLGFFFVPESMDPTHGALDPVGALLSIAALGSLLWAVIEAPSHGWGAPEIVAGFVAGALLLGAFFVWEIKSRHPMLDMRFFENPRFSAASGAISNSQPMPVDSRDMVTHPPLPGDRPAWKCRASCCRYLWTKAIAMLPSPTAEATRLTGLSLTSPQAKTPGTLDSRR